MLDVFLGELHVGVIVREEGILAFALDDAYADMPRRPVLGQQFEERRHHRVFRQTGQLGQLPTFFANLLPEGALHAMIVAQFKPDDAAATLAAVGEDLPGAVIVRPAVVTAALPSGAKRYDESLAPAPADDTLRFSLAGMQLKFSAVQSAEDRFTLPFRGLGGRWILKFGSEVYPGLPENEFSVMDWAQACGLNVPEHRLVPARAVAGLDARFLALGENVFGNTDAHLKNWSLVYPDGRSARLSPVYDFVCVRQYLTENELALPLAKEKRPERIGWAHIARVEKFLREHGHEVDLVKLGGEFVRRCMDEWASRRDAVDAPVRDAIERHLAGLPLVKELGAVRA